MDGLLQCIQHEAGMRSHPDAPAHDIASVDVDHALQAQLPHQPLDRASGHSEALVAHLPPDLAHAIDAEALGKDAHDLKLQIQIPLGSI